MALYTLHLPHGRRDAAALEQAVVLRDGFSWAAFIFGPLWLVWHRLWLGLGLYVAAAVIIGGAEVLLGLGPRSSIALDLLVALALGFEGRSLRRAKLEAQGCSLEGVAAARRQDEAERKLLGPLVTPVSTPAPAGAASRPASLRQQGEPDIIGLFPTPGA